MRVPQPPYPMERLQLDQSIDAAKAAMLRERAEVAQQTGLRFVVIRCPKRGCAYEADGCGLSEGQAEGRADRMLARHLFSEHWPFDGRPEAVEP